MFKRLKLKVKIIISIIVAAIFLCILVVAFVNLYLSKTLVNQKLEDISKLSKEQSEESIQIFENNKIFTKMLSERDALKEYLLDETEEKRIVLFDILSSYAQEDSKYLSLYLLNKEGQTLVSTDESFVGKNYSFRSYFKEGVKGNPFVDLLLGKTSNQFGYYFSYPVFSDSKDVLGVFISKIENTGIDIPILSSQVSKESSVMLVDENGIIITSNKPERFLKSLGDLTSIEKSKIEESKKFLEREILPLNYNLVQDLIRKGESSGSIKFSDEIDGEIEIINVNRLGDLPFYLVTETGIKTINNTVSRIIFILIGLIILGVIFAAFVLYRFILSSLSPLKELKLFAQDVSKGDFSKRIDIETKDEIGDLAIAFNKMSDNLGDLYKNLDKNVEKKTKEVNLKAEELEDQKVAILNILEDVQKEKEKTEMLANDLEKFKLAVDNASDQVVITNPEGVVIYGNKAVERITGFTPEEAIGKKAGVLWKTPMSLEYYENFWNVIKDQKKTFAGEIQNKRKNGTLYMANISVSPVLDDKGNIIYFVALEHDITKEKEIDKAKTEFVSLASHQLRTPLSSINWYTEMLLAGDAGDINEDQKKYLEEVSVGSQRMVSLVDSLLNVSRLDLGTFIIEPEAVDVVEMAQSVISELKPQVLKKKIKVEEFYGKDILEFQADRKLLRMVFQNLLSNAVKYTEPKCSVKIEISTMNGGDTFGNKILDGESLVFSVSDSGIGIPTDQQDKIFSKLFRADNARESETEGTGLGLYIIKSIIDQSGGSVWFKSEEDRGTTFYVSFPISGMKKKEGTKKLD